MAEPPPHLLVIILAEVVCLEQAEVEGVVEAVAVHGVLIRQAAAARYLLPMERLALWEILASLVVEMAAVLATQEQAVLSEALAEPGEFQAEAEAAEEVPIRPLPHLGQGVLEERAK